MLTLVVQDGNTVLGIGGHALILKGEDGVHDGVAGSGILGLVVQTGHKGGTVNEHILGCRSGANGISFAPVRQGRVIIFLLVVLLIIGEIQYAVRTVFAMAETGALGKGVLTHEGQGGEDN